MRVIKSSETEHTCGKCKSLIGIMPHDIRTIGPPGPYDMDYEPDEIGKRYWNCPICKCMNWIGPAPGQRDDDDY